MTISPENNGSQKLQSVIETDCQFCIQSHNLPGFIAETLIGR